MSLTRGSRIGVFQLIDLIGCGGMGEVYRARDTKLGRDVAIKILPEAFAHDSERLARFTITPDLFATPITEQSRRFMS